MSAESTRRAQAAWFAASGAIIALDQLAKTLVLQHFAPGESVPLAAFFNLVLVFNKGAAFSFLAGQPGWQTPLLAVFSAAAALLLAWLIWKHAARRLFCAGLALILGGALGNLVDRLRFGHVVDFLDFHASGWHFPAFNVADSAITVGAALLIYEGFLHDGRPRAA
ncbi:MAG: lipoprotein signal peptidase [Betaproteobacteria bacterium]|nr:lipoprotein signal peptidase [Betaproteobacteria bacterium]